MIVWGTTIRREHLGYVADYCLICQNIRAVRVTNLRKANHLYFIPLEKGTFEAVEFQCWTCKDIVYSEPRVDIPAKPSPRDLDLLLDDVPPEVLQDWQSRLKEDDDIRQGAATLTKEQRMSRIIEAFTTMEQKVANSVAQGIIVDKTVGLCFLIWAAIWVLCITAPSHILKIEPLSQLIMDLTGNDPFRAGLLVILVSGITLLAWLGLTAQPRFFKKTIYPELARILAPLRPTHDEINEVLAMLPAHLPNLTKRLKIAKLDEAMLAVRPKS